MNKHIFPQTRLISLTLALFLAGAPCVVAMDGFAINVADHLSSPSRSGGGAAMNVPNKFESAELRVHLAAGRLKYPKDLPFNAEILDLWAKKKVIMAKTDDIP